MNTEDQLASELIERLAGLGIEVQARGDRLLCHGSRKVVTQEIQRELALRKREILAFLQPSTVPAVDDHPLSFAQQRLWFLDQMQPGSVSYSLSMAQYLFGPLDTQALGRAVTGLVRQHETLRCIFPVVDDAPVQRVLPPFEAEVSIVDLRHLPSETRDREAQRLARVETEKPFDLAVGPLLRLSVYPLDEWSHIFVLVVHHMIADGWSVALLGRDLSAFYAAEVEAARPPQMVATPSTRYTDYSGWQRTALEGQAFQDDLRYWTKHLADAPRILALPLDRPRPPLPSYRGGRIEFLLDAVPTAELRKLARHAGASLYMLLLAVSSVLLARQTRETCVTIGCPVAGRDREEWAEVVGCFVNTLALKVDLTGDPTFMELLRRVRETSIAAYEHQNTPFEQVVEALQLERDLSRNPLVQVSVGLHNAPGQTPLATFPLPGLKATPIDLGAGTVRFDLELDIWEVADGLHIRMQYALDLFDEPTAARIASELEVLLGEVVADAERPVSRLPLVTLDQRRSLLAASNPQAVLPPGELLLHELVKNAATRDPDAVAVVAGVTSLRYGQLERCAEALAARLTEAGVRAGEPVGLCIGRGHSVVIGILAILKTGAAYVPLDPQHPPSRLQMVLDDCAARIVVMEPQFATLFSTSVISSVYIDADDMAQSPPHPVPVRPRYADESTAYIMYTSGSTGRPKGVAVPHRAVAGLLHAMHQVLPLGPQDVFLAVTTFAFDISVLELLQPLINGARLVIAQYEDTIDARRLSQTLTDRQVTCMQATPATWNILVEDGWSGAPHMTAMCGGETMPAHLAVALSTLCKRVCNVYGPTEATIWSSIDEVRADAPVTIGYPLENSEMYVLDKHLEPLPLGMVGEIWIGGHSLSHGYFKQPLLTAKNFVPDPFSARPGARLYRTGDLGLKREDGRLECLGRIDMQLKFRGFRIEPGDIEAAILSDSRVSQAVVNLFEEEAGEERLVAHVVPHNGKTLQVHDLHLYLQDLLPAYLVPSQYVILNSLPTGPNGKIDRASLPSPKTVNKPMTSSPGPRTQLEHMLAEIWAMVLGIDQVGLDDSFFALGGHSLLLTRVRAEIATRLERDVPVLDLFRWPTLRALAAHLDGTTTEPPASGSADVVSRQLAALERLAQAGKESQLTND